MIALLNAVLARIKDGRSSARVYKLGAVPASPTYPYTVVSLAGDMALNYTLDARHGTRNYRVALQSFSNTAAGLDGALDYDAKAVGALLDHALNVDGYDCGPMRLQVGSAVVRDPDAGGVVGVTSALIFTTTKETS